MPVESHHLVRGVVGVPGRRQIGNEKEIEWHQGAEEVQIEPPAHDPLLGKPLSPLGREAEAEQMTAEDVIKTIFDNVEVP